jgi:hypothetical protein
MIKRLHDKKAGIAILISLFIVSLVETIIRALQPGYAFSVTDLGEAFAIAILSAVILLLTWAKKDRLCYVFYGAFIGWFMLEEALSIPGTIKALADTIANAEEIAAVANGSAVMPIVAIAIHVLTSIAIVAIGALVLEYLSDGTICNRAFNAFCIIAVLLLLAAVIINVIGLMNALTVEIGLLILNNLHRIIMIFFFTCFVYDSAKMQLKKTDFTK